ncbi:MAG: hypothetical protein LQ337_002540 [Flavoplaca oasis]|nr:MAG: hypothetical protein LQ337_002540 [Flavoplaca oasis]
MPQSPPKRVTRARAKDVGAKPETTRVKTASARAATSKNRAAAPSQEPTTAGIQHIEESHDDPQEDAMKEQPLVEPPKTRGKAKTNPKSTVEKSVSSKTLSTGLPAKSTRSRTNNNVALTDTVEQLPKPRGRSKRNAEVEASIGPEPIVEDIAKDGKTLPLAKATRSRAATNAPAKPVTTRTRAAAAAPKKRVKFDNHAAQDKENQPIVVDDQKKPEAKATGLRAKPIRKPAVAKGGARATKGSKQEAKAEDDAPKSDVLPLSPKKVTQVAKTPSVGSEDELSGDKTPVRPLSKSPSKIPMSTSQVTDLTVSRVEVAPTNAPQSPSKTTSPGRLALSPRKPPPSPFKDSMKESPRKVDLGGRVAPSKFDAPSSPTKSPLKESPKRVNLGDSSTKPILEWSKTPLKSSLMKSPARRPGSAMKTSSLFSSKKASYGLTSVDATTAFQQINTSKLPPLLTECAASSPLRAAKTPGQQFRVHDPFEEQKTCAVASTATQSPPQKHETTKANKASQAEVGKLLSEAKESPQPIVDEVLCTKVSEAKAESNDETSSVGLVEHSDQIVNGGKRSLSKLDSHQMNGDETSTRSTSTPTGPPLLADRPSFVLASPMLVSRLDDSESEDELGSPEKQTSLLPLKTFGISTKDFGTPSIVTAAEAQKSSTRVQRKSLRAKRDSVAMTPLAVQMSSWMAASPERKANAEASYKRGIFSPVRPVRPTRNQSSPAAVSIGSPAKQSFFEDEMAIRGTDEAGSYVEEGSTDELQDCRNDELSNLGTDIQAELLTSADFQASQVYGDENANPEDRILIEQNTEDHTLTCTPARIFGDNPREIHTVSKVPLRPAADDTPLMVPRKRSKSLTAPLSEICMPEVLSIGRDSILSPILQDTNLTMNLLPGDVDTPNTPETATGGPRPAFSTPGRSIRKSGYSNVLKGAVVHVDVHTTEGADASGIFVDLLTQMGARCVKQWHWNPQASGASPQPDVSPEVGTPGNKVRITHVVYKDGGKRTLEKVREAKGVVLCVGVGWVLDCEREDKWLDEAEYAVDTSIIPRGGSRRRKSMEPRALANLNGSLIPAETPSKAPPVEISPTKEFMTFDTPVSRRETFEILKQIPSTPVADIETTNGGTADGEDFNSPLSPTTPYYLSKGAQLVQQTCPPKQSQELFFPLSGRIEDQPDAAVRQRLMMARRKSLQWASKVQSPLGRTVSYGK